MRPRALLRAAAFAALLAPSLAGGSARAQPATNAVAAEELFREGRLLIEQERYGEACEKLEASDKLDRAVGTLFSLGECYAAQGRNASAWFAFRGAAALAADAGNHRRVGADAADALEPETAHLVIHVSDAPADPVSMGDHRGGRAQGLGLPVDRGPHRVEARGVQSFEATVDVPTNGVTVTVLVPSLVPPPPPKVWRPARVEARRGAGADRGGVAPRWSRARCSACRPS